MRRKHKKLWLQEVNRREKQHCERNLVPYPGGFKTFNEAMNHLEHTPELSIWGSEMFQKGKIIREMGYFIS